MNNKPLSIYYESKVFPLVYNGFALVVGVYIFAFKDKTSYFSNPWFYVSCIFLITFLYIVFYSRSFFYIYKDKLVWEKGRHQITSSWDEIVAIHANCLPKNPFKRLGNTYLLYTYFYLETRQGITKQANESRIKLLGNSSFFQKNANQLIADIEKYSDKLRTDERHLAFKKLAKDKTRFPIFIIVIILIVLIGAGGLWYANYQFQQEMNAIPSTGT